MSGRAANAPALPAARRRLHAHGGPVALLTVVWVSMAILVDPRGDFAVNDDWVYAIAVKSVLAGHLTIPSFSTASVGPQAYWGALFCLPFGFSYTALRLSTLLLGLIGVIAIYGVVLTLWKRRVIAFVGALTIAVNPIYFSLANTFMTDVPFLALVCCALFCLLHGMERETSGTAGGWTRAGLGLALLAVLLRQVGLVVFAGYFVARIVKDGFGPRNVFRAAWPALAGLACHVGFNRWLLVTGRKPASSGIAVAAPDSVAGFLRTSLHESFVGLLYTGLFVVPLIVLVLSMSPWRTRRFSRGTAFVLAVTCAVGLVLLWRHETMPLGENILTYFGIGPLALHDTLILNMNLPPRTAAITSFWLVVTVATVVAAAVLLLALLVGASRSWRSVRHGGTRRASQWRAALLVSVAGSYAAILSIVANHNTLFDRYLLLFTVLATLAVPFLGHRIRWARPTFIGSVATGFAILIVGSFSTVATHDYLAWHRARSVAYRHLVDDQGVSPRRIDAGYEYTGADLYTDDYDARPGKSWWFVIDDEFVLAAGHQAGYVEIGRTKVDRWWHGGGADVLTLKRVVEAAR